MKIKMISSTVISLIFLSFSLLAQDRGVGVRVKTTGGQTKEVKLYQGSYALVIGESDYTVGWDNLAGVKNDVTEIEKVLKKQGFVVESNLNLTSDQLKARFDKFINDYGYQLNSRLLIYFAGHGHTQKAGDGRDLGYIIPVDTPLPEKDDLGFRRKAISMDTIQAYARQIESKHAMFVFDSCFSGKLISREKVVIPPMILEDVTYPVRQFITAGAANQTVPDDSIFRKAFVRGLEGEADRNSDGYITGTELADFLKEKVTNASDRSQTPQYGKIRDIDLDRGDFVFVLSGTTASAQSAQNRNNSYSSANPEKENEIWKQIENSSNIADFESFLKDFPDGTYSAIAQLKLRKLRESVSPKSSKTTENSNSLFCTILTDNSGSFRELLTTIIEANKTYVNNKSPDDLFSVVRFISSDKIEVAQDFTKNKTDLYKSIDSFHIEGGASAIIDAVYLTVEKMGDVGVRQNLERHRRVILLLTDGDERESYYKEEQLIAKLQENQVQMFIIGYVKDLENEGGLIRKSPRKRAIEFLNRLAKATNGKVFFPESKKDILRVANEINVLMRTKSN